MVYGTKHDLYHCSFLLMLVFGNFDGVQYLKFIMPSLAKDFHHHNHSNKSNNHNPHKKPNPASACASGMFGESIRFHLEFVRVCFCQLIRSFYYYGIFPDDFSCNSCLLFQ